MDTQKQRFSALIGEIFVNFGKKNAGDGRAAPKVAEAAQPTVTARYFYFHSKKAHYWTSLQFPTNLLAH